MWWFEKEFKEEEKKEKKKKRRKIAKKKKIKRVLIKFWEVKWKEEVLVWRRRDEKKLVEWKFQKELTFRQILKTLPIFTFTHFYFIPFAFTLHYVLIKSLFDLEDCVVHILIWLNIKCGINSFWHPFMRLLVLSWLSIFSCDLYVRCLILLTLFRSHILLRVYTPFQSDFICWVITLERFELKHNFK